MTDPNNSDIYAALAQSAQAQNAETRSTEAQSTARQNAATQDLKNQPANNPKANQADTDAALQQQSAAPGLFAQFGLYWQQLRHESLLQLQLFTLEAQLAAESLVAIWLLALWAGLMLIGAWLLLQLLIWQGLQALGLAGWQSLLILFLLQISVLFICLRLIRYHSRFLRFAQTLTSLRPNTAPLTDTAIEPANTERGATQHA